MGSTGGHGQPVVFTDIEGSTRLLQELGDAYTEPLEEHHRALRTSFGRHGGVEVNTWGDACADGFEQSLSFAHSVGDAWGVDQTLMARGAGSTEG